jgi:hypothetical protein
MYNEEAPPRIIPTPQRIQAILGLWKCEGEIIRLQREADTGVLIATNLRGEAANPLKVISHGIKLEDQPGE